MIETLFASFLELSILFCLCILPTLFIFYFILSSLRKNYFEGKSSLISSVLYVFFILPIVAYSLSIVLLTALSFSLQTISGRQESGLLIVLLVPIFFVTPIITSILSLVTYFKLKEFKNNNGIIPEKGFNYLALRYTGILFLITITSLGIALLIAKFNQ